MPNNNKKVIVFLDLLGFKVIAQSDPEGALKLLSNSMITYNLKKFAQKLSEFRKSKKENTAPELYPLNEDQRETLNKAIEQGRITSFDSYYPMSDSIIITSQDANMLVPQLSNFLIACIDLNMHKITNPENQDNLFQVTEKHYSFTTEGATHKEKKVNWYPTLYRGGISYGDFFEFEVEARHKGKEYKAYNIASSSYVEAVGLEKSSGKGPRLFCDNAFYGQLNDDMKKFVALVNEKTYEILWPAFYYLDNRPEDEINKFYEPFSFALKLYNHYKNSELQDHYLELLKLICKSTLAYFENKNYGTQAHKHISANIDDETLRSVLGFGSN